MKSEIEVVDMVIDERLRAKVDDLLASTSNSLHEPALALPPLDRV